MTDRFKGDRATQDFTFYSMSRKQEELNKKKKTIDKEKIKAKFSTGKYMYCSKCAGNPIIKVDNANKYICSDCLMKMTKNRTKWNI
tara:strand:+ start:400 stop:657 length:258 start_codon:yes stop_codon:yes gene_type:complete